MLPNWTQRLTDQLYPTPTLEAKLNLLEWQDQEHYGKLDMTVWDAVSTAICPSTLSSDLRCAKLKRTPDMIIGLSSLRPGQMHDMWTNAICGPIRAFVHMSYPNSYDLRVWLGHGSCSMKQRNKIFFRSPDSDGIGLLEAGPRKGGLMTFHRVDCAPLDPHVLLFNRIFKTGSSTTELLMKKSSRPMNYEYHTGMLNVVTASGAIRVLAKLTFI